MCLFSATPWVFLLSESECSTMTQLCWLEDPRLPGLASDVWLSSFSVFSPFIVGILSLTVELCKS